MGRTSPRQRLRAHGCRTDPRKQSRASRIHHFYALSPVHNVSHYGVEPVCRWVQRDGGRFLAIHSDATTSCPACVDHLDRALSCLHPSPDRHIVNTWRRQAPLYGSATRRLFRPSAYGLCDLKCRSSSRATPRVSPRSP